MGEALDPVIIHAFRAEMEKIALLGGLGKNLLTLGKRAINPAAGFREGSKFLSPAGALARGGKSKADLIAAMTKTRKGGALRQTFGAGTHLAAPSRTLMEAGRGGGARGVAAELSRRGWTGKGKLTKYMPVGDKGQLATVWPAMSVPMIASGGATPEGEVGGNLGFLAGGMLSAGTGLPGMAATMLAGHYGGELGRKIRAARGAGEAVPQGGQT